jgi:hypothetical protein
LQFLKEADPLDQISARIVVFLKRNCVKTFWHNTGLSSALRPSAIDEILQFEKKIKKSQLPCITVGQYILDRRLDRQIGTLFS